MKKHKTQDGVTLVEGLQVYVAPENLEEHEFCSYSMRQYVFKGFKIYGKTKQIELTSKNGGQVFFYYPLKAKELFVDRVKMLKARVETAKGVIEYNKIEMKKYKEEMEKEIVDIKEQIKKLTELSKKLSKK